VVFFDTINHGLLRSFIEKKVKDGGISRLIGKWLNAGVLDAGEMIYPDMGTPQGGVASPMLANIFLHYVLDEWFVQDVQPRLKGRSFLIRFADDFIIGFEHEADARRVLEVLSKRFSRFKLTIHPEKTKLVRFVQPTAKEQSVKENGTFDFLGFTHYWAKSLRGNWVIKRRTIGKRLRRFMKAVWEWCRENRHDPVKEQHKTLCSKLRGYYQYYGIRGNYELLEDVFEHAERAWRHWLGKRNSKGYVNLEKFDTVFRKVFPLPKPRIFHNI
jgi:RNA-directed DNA polymerase